MSEKIEIISDGPFAHKVLISGQDVAATATAVTVNLKAGYVSHVVVDHDVNVHITTEANVTHVVWLGPIKAIGPSLLDALEGLVEQVKDHHHLPGPTPTEERSITSMMEQQRRDGEI